MSQLTGRTRYRVTWLGRLVLQVEVDVTGSPWVSQMDIGPHTSWRDARCEDLGARGQLRTRPMPLSEHLRSRHPNPPASPAKDTK